MRKITYNILASISQRMQGNRIVIGVPGIREPRWVACYLSLSARARAVSFCKPPSENLRSFLFLLVSDLSLTPVSCPSLLGEVVELASLVSREGAADKPPVPEVRMLQCLLYGSGLYLRGSLPNEVYYLVSLKRIITHHEIKSRNMQNVHLGCCNFL